MSNSTSFVQKKIEEKKKETVVKSTKVHEKTKTKKEHHKKHKKAEQKQEKKKEEKKVVVEKKKKVSVADMTPDQITGRDVEKQALSQVLKDTTEGDDLLNDFITSSEPGEEKPVNAWLSTSIEGQQ